MSQATETISLMFLIVGWGLFISMIMTGHFKVETKNKSEDKELQMYKEIHRRNK